MSTTIFDQDFLAGTTKLWHEEPDGTVHIETVQDIEPLLQANAELRKDRGADRFRIGDGSHQNLVGRIPLWLLFVLRKRGIEGPALIEWLEKHPKYKTTSARLA